MRRSILAAVLGLLSASRAFSQEVPAADHHQHLFSPDLVDVVSRTEPVSQFPPITAKDLIGHLDAAGIKRAVVLSTAYIFSQPSRKVENDYERVSRSCSACFAPPTITGWRSWFICARRSR
jgi:hypothetical protein